MLGRTLAFLGVALLVACSSDSDSGGSGTGGSSSGGTGGAGGGSGGATTGGAAGSATGGAAGSATGGAAGSATGGTAGTGGSATGGTGGATGGTGGATGGTGGSATGGTGGATGGTGGATGGTGGATGGSGGTGGGQACTWGGAACPGGQYCNAPGCASGKCEPIPAETNTKSAVCGCDGVTYWNASVAGHASMSVKGSGECGQGAKSCGGIAGLPCPASTFCNYNVASAAMCNVSDSGGKCWGMPATCPSILIGPQMRACKASTCSSECELIKKQSVWYNDNTCPV
ncbi:MAG: hypothetical protein U0263_15860 [Polyangiaceae bacterium]